MIYSLYRSLTTLGGPLVELYLRRRLKRGKEDAARFGERHGIPSLPRPDGKLVWLHAASVGESISMLPVVERLVAQGLTLLVTTGTVTSAKLMAERLPPGALHQYIPVDRLAWVRSFLDHWKPDAALWCESEFWPNLLMETARRSIPLLLVNGRISDRSFVRWQKYPSLIGPLLGCFRFCLGQTLEDAERLLALGAPKARCRGNLKYAAPPLPVDQAELSALTSALGDRPRWLLASSHPGEEPMAGRVHRALKARFPDLLTILVPRHPQRGAEIAAELKAEGLTVSRRAAHQPISADSEILLADTLGELGLFYRLAPVALMGKSLGGKGGQNPLEPARLGAAVLFGPHMDNFAEMARRLRDEGAAWEVADEDELAESLQILLTDPGKAAALGAKAQGFAAAEAGVLDAVLAELAPYLPHPGDRP